MNDLDNIIKIAMEQFILPSRIKRKAIKDDLGRIVGHEIKKEPFLPDALKKTHELRSYKKPGGDSDKKELKVAVRMDVGERNKRRRSRERGTYDPQSDSYYDKKAKNVGEILQGSSSSQKGISRGSNEQGMAHLIGRMKKNKRDSNYNINKDKR